MANLTITVDDEILRRARVRATEQDTSVNSILRDYLEAYAAAGQTPIRGRVEDGRGVRRSRESLLPAAFAVVPVPQSRPWLRFPSPLIEPDVRIYRIRLSDWLHDKACADLR